MTLTVEIPGVLSDLKSYFSAQKWDLSDADKFKMEAESAVADAGPAPAAEPASAPDPAPTPATTEDPFDNAATQQFDRAYVQKLRQEAADRRTSLKAYEEIYQPYAQEERDVWNNLIKITAQDPEKGAELMLDLHHRLMGSGPYAEEGEPAGKEDESGPDDRPLTKKELELYLAVRNKKEQENQKVAAVQSEAEALGYKSGTHQYVALLRRALDEHQGDIQAAHKAFEGDRQVTIDAFVAEQAKKNAGYPTLPGAGGAPPADVTGGPAKDWKGAKARLEARLANL